MASKISIITVNYNNVEGLQKTLDSVFSQTYRDFEYIIIDGGSTDGSKELIEKNAGSFSYWVSEKDKGIFNGMNKGIDKANGDYLLFLNSGDYLYNESVLNDILPYLGSTDIVFGDIIWAKKEEHINGHFPDILSFEFMMNYSLPHQASFIHHSLFNTVGLFDENNRIISDWVFFISAIYKFNYSYKHVNFSVTYYDCHGISSDPANAAVITEHRNLVLKKHFGNLMDDYAKLLVLRNELKSFTNSIFYKLFIKSRKYYRKIFK